MNTITLLCDIDWEYFESTNSSHHGICPEYAPATTSMLHELVDCYYQVQKLKADERICSGHVELAQKLLAYANDKIEEG
jgi:hypothetical protein